MARPKKFEIPEDVPVARIEEEVVEQQPAAAPDNALDVYDVDPAANQSRFRGKARAAILGVAIGLGGIAAYNLWPESNESSTGNQTVEPAPPPPVAPAPVAPTPARSSEVAPTPTTPDAQVHTEALLADWVAGYVDRNATAAATAKNLEGHGARASYTFTCKDGSYSKGSGFFQHLDSAAVPSFTKSTDQSTIQIDNYGAIDHPRIVCAKYAGEDNQYSKYWE